MRSNRVELCTWLAWAGDPYELKWDVIERHLDHEQYKWFFKQPLYKVQLVLDTEYRLDDQRWITLVAEFFDMELFEAYQLAWAK